MDQNDKHIIGIAIEVADEMESIFNDQMVASLRKRYASNNPDIELMNAKITADCVERWFRIKQLYIDNKSSIDEIRQRLSPTTKQWLDIADRILTDDFEKAIFGDKK